MAAFFFSNLLFQEALHFSNSEKSIPNNSSVSLIFPGVAFPLEEAVVLWEEAWP